MGLKEKVIEAFSVDLFKEARKPDAFVGRPFHLDYEKATVLVADAWKQRVNGIPQGTFLLAFYENEESVKEAILLRALAPSKLPTDNDVISSMVEYYKDNLKTAGAGNDLDDFTRYQFSFSALECRILGTFYKNKEGKIVFGADLENFYSANNYSVYKPDDGVLEQIVNYRDLLSIPGGKNDVKIGRVRYSSSLRLQEAVGNVSVYITAKDFLGKRSALFGMTRTGKSNTVKKIVQATMDLSKKATHCKVPDKATEGVMEPYDASGVPLCSVGQLIFDVNGEYANANMQDEGTAIFEMYKKDTVRYSTMEKEGFEIMKVNFYNEVEAGFDLVQNHFRDLGEKSDYVSSFLSVVLEKPEDYDTDPSVATRYDRKKAAYLCCLAQAGFPVPNGFKVRFSGNKDINSQIREGGLDPSKGVTLSDATLWFTSVWDHYNDWEFFKEYYKKHGHGWADEELRAVLGFLTRHKEPGSSTLVSGYTKLKPLIRLHTDKGEIAFEANIVAALREGKIVIVDLSQGDPDVQRLYSERICKKIFSDSMGRFVENRPNGFIQLYFEEAHNLFPKKDDKDLAQIYNRLAKEGAKLNLGLIYATQEVSSISANILKNTQNWFIAHLNNDDELKELVKYYDFTDFAAGLLKFSANSDKGFVRMKTYSNPFVVPVQVDQFKVKSEK